MVKGLIDYQGIAALAAVIETQGFQSAADKLCITQSAISQRIKALEQYYGEHVLIRTIPYRLTELGLTLVGHYKHVVLLEDALEAKLDPSASAPRVSLSISRDSLETWFVVVLDQLKHIMPITIEIIADDQEHTLDFLKNGLVSACASTTKKPLSGCKSDFLGYFDYILAATPGFKREYFQNSKEIRKKLLESPSMIFDQNDKLHADYLKHFFRIDSLDVKNCHVMPSVAGFKRFILNGYAYALIPKIDIEKELLQKKLVNLFPDKIWEMPVYWHAWQIENKAFKLFNELVQKVASKLLRQ